LEISWCDKIVSLLRGSSSPKESRSMAGKSLVLMHAITWPLCVSESEIFPDRHEYGFTRSPEDGVGENAASENEFRC
jgi:hypothetical protein